jgi:O-antigen/teichoic acid export membrane protein
VGALVCNDRETLGALLGGRRAFTRRAQTTFSLRASGAALLQTASGRADIVLLGVMDGARSVGIYSVAVGASELIWFLGHSLATADYGEIGRMDEGSARRATRRLGINASALAAIQAVPLALIAHTAMEVIFGPDFRVSGDYLIVLLVGAVVGAPLFAVANYFTNQLGRPGMALVLSGIMLVVTAAACVTLIPPFGAMGAAVASSIGYGVGLVYAVVAMRRVSARPAAADPRLP